VLLRKIGFKTTQKEDDTRTIWEGSAEGTRAQVKALLLEGYEKEAVVGVRNQLCDTIADVAREAEEQSSINTTLNISQWRDTDFAEPWNELLAALFQSTKSPEPAHRESAFRVFAALPSIVDKSHVELLKGVFLEGLQDPAPQVPPTAHQIAYLIPGPSLCS
jgi:importin-5